MTTDSVSPMDALVARARDTYHAVPADKLVRNVARLFDFIDDGDDEFTYPGLAASTRERIFGGQVIAQAMMVAARTVDPARHLHSLHAYFLRAGDERQPLHFRVHRDMDGGSFSNRRVVVRQLGEVIFNLTASFQRPTEGMTHQVPMPDLLPPEQCWDFGDFLAHSGAELTDDLVTQMARPRPFETRFYRPPPSERATSHYQWFRLRSPIGDDPLLHRAFLAYASDMGLLSTSMLPHGLHWASPGLFSTSLDHAMWFHNAINVEDWFVYVMDSDWTGGTRGINHGRIYRQDGTLIASSVQEGLLRFKRGMAA